MRSPEVNRYLESRFTEHSFEDLRHFVASMECDPLNLFTGIFLKDGTHIGNIKLGPIDVRHSHADIGLIIGQEYWGKGYATEAIGLITDYAFDEIGLHRVTAGTYADNEGSTRAFEKNGFQREGLLKDHWLFEGSFQDGIRLGKVAGN